MSITDLFTQIRDTLQDKQKERWTDQELFRYLDQANRSIAVATKFNKIKETINVVEGTTEYPLKAEVIDFYSVGTIQEYELTDAKTITFPNPKDQSVPIEYYAYTPRVYFGATTELEFEEDLYDAIRYFILYRCYQKEASTENIQKAQYFKGEYANVIQSNLTRWHGTFGNETSRQEYYR